MPKGRGVRCPFDELMVMLDCIKDNLPIGMNEWEIVERRHHQVYQGVFRSKASLKHNLRALVVNKIPTGDPLVGLVVVRNEAAAADGALAQARVVTVSDTNS